MNPSVEQNIRDRRAVLCRKPFLQALYREWYALIGAAITNVSGPVLEIGAGPGFLDTIVSGAIRSDIEFDRQLDAVLDATALPFADAALGSVVGINVFHHISQPRRFFLECIRCLRQGGRIALLEPWNTPWAAFCMRLFHHESFRPNASGDSHDSERLRSQANNALAWIVFERDKRLFEATYPELGLVSIVLLMPFAYLLSGGIHRRTGAPGWTYPLVRHVERLCKPLLPLCAMFALIVLERREGRYPRQQAT